MIIKSFDIVKIIVSEANKKVADGLVLSNENVGILEQYCSAIDDLMTRRDGREFKCEIDEDTLAVEIGFVIRGITVDRPRDDDFTRLIARAAKVAISSADEDHIRVDFTFPTLWKPE